MAKKNRRKWCKGREGVEHNPIWVPTVFGNVVSEQSLQYRCQACNKILDTFSEGGRLFLLKYAGWDIGDAPVIGSSEPSNKGKG